MQDELAIDRLLASASAPPSRITPRQLCGACWRGRRYPCGGVCREKAQRVTAQLEMAA